MLPPNEVLREFAEELDTWTKEYTAELVRLLRADSKLQAQSTQEEVARAIITLGNQVLVCRGQGQSFTHLPGGHVEAGENPASALLRELREELGRDATEVRSLGILENVYDKQGTTIHETQHLFAVKLFPVLAEQVPERKEPWLEVLWAPIQDLNRPEINLMPPSVIPYVMQVAGGNGAV